MKRIMVIAFFLRFFSSLAYSENQVHIFSDDKYRYIESNGIPDHVTGIFPNQGNPNRITEQHHHFRVSLKPAEADHLTPGRGWFFGIALNGVPFEPGTAEAWNDDLSSGWNYEALTGFLNLGMDQNNAHVQPNGTYHYHGIPTALVFHQPPSEYFKLLGYAADGFPIYALYGYSDPKDPNSALIKMTSSYRLKKGIRPSGPGGTYDGRFTQDFEYVENSGTLDECNGRFGGTPEYPEGIYHYFLTENFPFIPRYFRGGPDASFRHQDGPRRRPPGGSSVEPPAP